MQLAWPLNSQHKFYVTQPLTETQETLFFLGPQPIAFFTPPFLQHGPGEALRASLLNSEMGKLIYNNLEPRSSLK